MEPSGPRKSDVFSLFLERISKKYESFECFLPDAIKLTVFYSIYNQNKLNLILERNVASFEEFEDTRGVIRIRISQKNRQHNGQKKKYKRTNNDLQNIYIKLKIE